MLHLDYRDARPIYEQVKDGLRRLMVTGVIREGEKLPSVRAYEALEAEGYVYSVPGKGSFAAPNTGVDEGRRTELYRVFDQAAAELLFLGVKGQELRGRLGRLEGGKNG